MILVQNSAYLLIIDPDAARARDLNFLLSSQGYRVDSAPRFDLALSLIETQFPDLVFVDAETAQTNQFDICKQLESRAIPVIITSSSLSNRADWFRMGAIDYLPQPWEPEEVQAKIGTYLTFQRQRHTIDRLRRQARHYLDIAAMILLVLDAEGTIVMLNQAGHRLLGYDPGELIGQDWFASCLPPGVRSEVRDIFDQIVSGDMKITEYIENPVQTRSGAERIIQWHNSVLRDENGQVLSIVSSGEDITNRKQAQEDESELQALRDSAAALTSTLELDEVLSRILDNLESVVPHDAANIQVIEPEGYSHIIACRGYEARGLTREAMMALRFPIESTEDLAVMVETRQTFIVSNTENYPGWIAIPETIWVKSFLGAPIFVEAHLIGFLNLDSKTPGFFTPEYADRLKAFADQTGVAIRNAQLYEQIHRYADELEQRVQERTAALEESETRYRAIVEDQTDLICRWLPDTTLTFANSAYARNCGRTPDELIGQSFLPLVYEEDRDFLVERIARLTQENPVVTITHRSVDEHGLVWQEWTNRAIFDEAGTLREVQAVGRDITERVHAQDALLESLTREIELNEMKSRFLAMAAHDLRNPLTVIQIATDYIARYGDHLSDPQKQERFARIKANIAVMIEMLDDVLTLGKTDNHPASFRPEAVNLEEFCQVLIAEVSAHASQRIVFSALTEHPIVNLDKKLLRHIISNLLSNALKYSPPDDMILFDLTAIGEQTTIRIQDHGIGIPAADLNQLFDPFYRGSNVGIVGGSGLGLAIVKQSVDLHGGTISVESHQDMGTLFTVTLPHA